MVQAGILDQQGGNFFNAENIFCLISSFFDKIMSSQVSQSILGHFCSLGLEPNLTYIKTKYRSSPRQNDK